MFGGKAKGKGKAELLSKLLSGGLDLDELSKSDPRAMECEKNQRASQGTRKERIARHLELVKGCQKEQRGHTSQASTFSYERKTTTSDCELRSLTPIQIKELMVGQVHYSHALYCRTITPCCAMQSIMTLVEDSDGEIADIAVYNSPSIRSLQSAQRYLPKGRVIAIKEPFFKLRADGTLGIRIDDPKELILDAELPGPIEVSAPVATSLEDRLSQILKEDNSIGKKRVRELLQAEGFSVSLKRVQELLGVLRLDDAADASAQPTQATHPAQVDGETSAASSTQAPLQLPRRDPDSQRVFRSAYVRELRDAGNAAIKAARYSEAEKSYSKAIKNGKREEIDSLGVDEGEGGVQLWTLFSNRAAARLHLNLPDEALQDSLLAHCCAPQDEVKPVLRCVEAMAALCLHSEIDCVVQTAVAEFPNCETALLRKQRDLSPKVVLRVGDGQAFSSIMAAVLTAPPGAEILVGPGVYHEVLFLTKPVTIHSVDAVEPNEHWVHGAQPGKMVQVWAKGCHAISISAQGSVCLRGLRIVCNAAPEQNLHAVEAIAGVAVLRHCSLSSTSGPIVGADHGARVILEHCAVHDGGQGGLIAVNGATLVLSKVFCCRAAASGLELRADGRAVLESCSFFGNGRAGLFIWNGAGSCLAKDTEIHSNNFESGVLVQENTKTAVFKACKIYGNGSAGVAVQTKGLLHMQECDVHSNFEGILIQSSGNASIVNCDVSKNRANGIFVGYDHVGSAQITGNRVTENQMKGILLGTGHSKNVTAEDNKERRNRGAPPLGLPSQAGGRERVAHRNMDMREWAKNMQKSGGSSKKAACASGQPTFIDALLASGCGDQIEENLVNASLACGYCKKPPGTNKFSKCSKCLAVNYCSSECQAAHWSSGHKTECKPPPPKHPSFINCNQSVDDVDDGRSDCALQ